MNALTAQSAANPHQNDLELIDETPLSTLVCDIKNLHNCLDGYREQLSTSLSCQDSPGRWGGVRFSRTTTGLFGAVVLFTIILNVVLTAMSADQQQLLQANCGIGILYALVCMAVLNDMASAKTAVRSESESLQLRVLDVMDQFRELLRTRQAWVEESTRTQWSCETDKLKLQLAEQELQSKQESIALSRTTWEDLQKAIAIAEGQSNKLAQEVVDSNSQLAALKTQHTDLADATKLLDEQRAQVLEQLEQVRLDVEQAQQQLSAANQAKADSEKELLSVQKSIAELREEANVCAAIVAEQSSGLAERNKEIELAQQQLDNLTASIELKQLERETLDSQIDQELQLKLAQTEELAAVSQELVALRHQRENFTNDRERLETEHEALELELTKLRDEAASCATQNAQTLALLQTNGEQLMECMAERLAVDTQLETVAADVKHHEERLARRLQEIDDLNELVAQQESNLSELTQQETALQAKVDWLLSQLGELERLSLAQMANGSAVEELDASLRERQATIDALAVEESGLRSAVAELNQHVKALTHDRQAQQARVDELKLQSEQLEADIEQIRMLTVECRQEFADLTNSTRQQIAERQNEVHVCEEKSKQRGAELDALSAATSVAQELLNESEAELYAKQKQLDEQQVLIRAKADELTQTETLLVAARQSLVTTQQAEQVAEERAMLLLEKAESIAEQVRVRSDELQEAAIELEAIRAEIHSLEAVRLQFDALVGDSDKLEDRLEQQRSEAIELAERIELRRGQEAELQTTVRALSEQIESLRGEADAVEFDRLQRQSQLESLESELILGLQRRDSLEREVVQLLEHIDSQSEHMRSLDQSIEVQVVELKQLDNSRAKLKDEVTQYERMIAEFMNSAEAAQNLLQTVNDQHQGQLHELNSVQQRLDAAAARELQLTSQLEKLGLEETRLNGRVESLTGEVNESQSIANQWHEYIEKLKSEVQRLESDKSIQQRQIEDAQRRLHEQQARFDDLLSNVRRAENRLADCESECRSLELRSKDLHVEINRTEAGQSRLLQQIDQAESSLEALLQEQGAVQHALNDARQQLLREQSAVEQLEAGHDRLLSTIDAAEQRAHQLQSMVDERQRDQSELAESIVQLEKAKLNLEHEAAISLRQRQQCEDDLAQLQTLTQQTQQQLQEVEGEVSRAKAMLDEVSMVVEQQREQKIAVTSDLNELQFQVQSVREQLAIKTEELVDCTADLATQNATAAAVQEQLDSMRMQVEQLRAEDEELFVRRTGLSQELALQQEETGRLVALAKRARKGLQRLSGHVQEKESQLAQLQQAIVAGDADVERNFVRLADLQAESAGVETRLREQELLIQKVELQIAEKLAALASLQQRIERSQAAKASLEQNLTQLNAQNQRVAQELKSLESQHSQNEQSSAQQLAQQEQAIADLTQRCEQLQSQETDLQSTIARLEEAASVAQIALNELAQQQQQQQQRQQQLVASSVVPAIPSTPAVVLEDKPVDSLMDSSRAEVEEVLLESESIEDDVWSSVRALTEMMHDSRSSGASSNVAIADPWATIGQ